MRVCSKCKEEKSEFASDRNRCKDCESDRKKTWNRANPDKVRAWNVGKENSTARMRAWRAANPEKLKSSRKVSRSRRRAAERECVSTLTSKEWSVIWEDHGGLCFWCGMLAECMDHIVPLIPRSGGQKGSNTRGNVVPSCDGCNGRKSNKDPLTFYFESLCP